MENDVIRSIQSKMEEIEALRNQVVVEMRTNLIHLFKPIFEKYKFIHKLSWVQYTPYFNDGDECIFGTSFDHIRYCKDVEDYVHKYLWNGDLNEKYNSELSLDIDALIKTLALIGDDFYKSLFGDHVEVIVYRDGKILIEEYDHD